MDITKTIIKIKLYSHIAKLEAVFYCTAKGETLLQVYNIEVTYCLEEK